MTESNTFNDFYVYGDHENFLTASFLTERRAVPEQGELISVIVGIISADGATGLDHTFTVRKQGVTTGMPVFTLPSGVTVGTELFTTTRATFLANEHISATVVGNDVGNNVNYSFIYRFRRN